MSSPRVVFIYTNPREETLALVRLGQDADTPLHGMNHIPDATYVTIPPQSLSAIRFLPQLLRSDVIVAQDNFFLGAVVSWTARLCGLKTKWVYTAIHSSTLLRRHKRDPLHLFLFKLFWSSYAQIICLCEEQVIDLLRLGLKRERLIFIPFGVDVQFFHPTDTAREESLVVSGGRDSGRDYHTLLTAVATLSYETQIFAGERVLPKDTALPQNVSVLYNISLMQVRALYERAQVVVVASKDEAAPDGSDCSGQTVILDALAAGKAVIATERSWIKDYFTAGVELVVVPPNDALALAQAIDRLMRDQAQRRRLAEAGRHKVATVYTTKTFAQAVQTVIHSLTQSI